MNLDDLDRRLRESVADLRLSDEEKVELRELGTQLDVDRIRYLRNRAFAMTRELIAGDAASAQLVLRWLEQVVRTLDASAPSVPAQASVHFSPGEECRDRLTGLCLGARKRIDICVFTLADDHLADAVHAAHRRGVQVRLISDDDKALDAGSDIAHLQQRGVPVRIDRSPYHMHHKFAVFDQRTLASGSFNWTRSASRHNHENILVTDDPRLVDPFADRFEHLWASFA